MAETESENQPLRRRSARLSPLQTNQTNAPKMAPVVAASADTLVKRSITVRKIAPRKTTLAPSQHNKENTPKRAVSEGVQEKKQKLTTPENVPPRSSSSGKRLKKSAIPSPILPSPPLTAKNPKAQTPRVQTRSQSPKVQDQSHEPPAVDPEAAAWSHKVRRSYSRLSEKSFTSPDSSSSSSSSSSRLSLFGFEKLQTPEVMRKSSRSGLEAPGSLSSSALASFTSLLEAEDSAAAPDLHIPGVALVKEKKKKKRRKVQQLDGNEMDALAAKMNAEFEEAEDFELLVE